MAFAGTQYEQRIEYLENPAQSNDRQLCIRVRSVQMNVVFCLHHPISNGHKGLQKKVPCPPSKYVVNRLSPTLAVN